MVWTDTFAFPFGARQSHEAVLSEQNEVDLECILLAIEVLSGSRESVKIYFAEKQKLSNFAILCSARVGELKEKRKNKFQFSFGFSREFFLPLHPHLTQTSVLARVTRGK